MSKITQAYTNNSIQKMVVDSLAKDGAFCNYYEKYYLEQETYDGGTGDRLAFKKYNDKIIKYHLILKVLRGERKANIYEAIPAIDFIHPDNTSFLYTYPEIDSESSNKKIDPTKIIPIDSYDHENALDLINNEDPYTINRVLAGKPTAEHFYNTKEFISSSYNIQTTFPGKDNAFIYRGIKIPSVIMNGEEITGTRKTSVMIYRVNNSVDVYFNPMDSTKFDRVDYKSTYIDGEKYIVDSTNNNNYIILNTDCGWEPESGIKGPILFEGEYIITKNETTTASKGTHYISLQSGDILVAIPSTTYSLDPNKILVLRSHVTETTYVEETREAIEGYLNTTNGLFYKDSQFTNKYDPAPFDIYIDINSKLSGQIKYYQYDASIKKYFLMDEDLLSPVDNTGLTFNVRVATSPYSCYILYVNSFNSGLNNYASFTELNPGDKLDSLTEDTSVIRIMQNYLDIDSTYFGNASGLMNGYFCEPYEYDSSSSGTTVTKWKFVNDVDIAAEKGVSIDVGSKYYSGHLLGRGNLKDEPLKLTPSDYLTLDNKTYYASCSGKTPTLESIGINGKASLIYKKLINDEIIDRLFQSAEVPNWENFESRIVTNVITKFDYSDTKLGSSEAINLLGTSNPYTDGRPAGSVMAYKNKFYRNGSLLNYEDILDYIDFFDEAIQGHTLVLDSVNKDNALITYGTTRNKKVLSCEGAEQWDRHDAQFSQNNTILTNEFGKAFTATYYVHYKSNGSTVVERKFPYVNTISPLNLMNRSYISSKIAARRFSGLENFIRNVWSVLGNTSTKIILASIGVAGVAAVAGALILAGPVGWIIGGVVAIVVGLLSLFGGSSKINTNPWTYTQRTSVDDAILLFPEYNRYFPENILLFSGRDLKLEPYSKDPSHPTRGICSFLDAQDGKIILFKVSNAKSIKFSQINQIKLTSQECSNLTFSYDGSNIAEDFYIYYLTPISLNIDNNIEIYDWNDKKIDLIDYEKSNRLVAASYPNNYFPVKLRESTDGTYHYEIDINHRNTDFDYLWGSIIIPGLPDFHNYKDLALCRKDNYSLEPLAKMLYGDNGDIFSDDGSSTTSQNISSLVKRLLNSILSTWPLSDSESNPLLVKDLPELLKGIIDFGNEIRNFSDCEFEIDAKGKMVTVSPESMYNFINRIDNNDNTEGMRYSITVPNSSSYKPFSESEIKNITLNDSFNDVPSVIAKRLNQINIRVVTDKKIKARPSFRVLYNTFKDLLSNGQYLSVQNCTDLDNYLGNGTKAFISMGDLISDGEIVHTLSSQFTIDIENLYNSATDITRNTINEAFDIKDTYIKNKQLSILRNKYANYYTSESVIESITLKDGILNIDNNKLKINPNTSESRKVLSRVQSGQSYINGIKVLSVVSWILSVFGYWKYKDYTLDQFIEKFVSDESTEDYPYILKSFNSLVEPVLNQYNSEFDSSVKSLLVNSDDIKKYFNQEVNFAGYTLPTAILLYYKLNVADGKTFEYDWKTIAPSISADFEFINAYGTCPESDAPTYYSFDEESQSYKKLEPQPTAGSDVSSYYLAKRVKSYNLSASSISLDKLFERIYDLYDINEDILWGISEFAKTALQGTNTGGSNEEYYVKYVDGETDTPVGRGNSLYFKRYKMLNNRLNRLEGNLWLAASYLRNSTVFADMSSFSTQYLESYERFMEVMPVADVESLTYMPKQEATTTTIQLEGKFYSDKELEALKCLINNVCTLNCTSCQVKDSCPFYDQNEVVKMYCTGIETIDLWVKDNELDLIADDDDAIQMSDKLASDTGFSRSKMSMMHFPYSEIREKVYTDEDNTSKSIYYNINDMVEVKDNLKSTYGADYYDYVTDDLGWLSNGRYGVVERNTVKNLLVDPETGEILNDEISKESIDRIHPYRFMYDALFIKASGYSGTNSLSKFDPEEDSYIKYSSSYHRYPFSFEKGPETSRQLYEGTAKIKIPVALKLLSYASDDDDLYLVSDDKKDANGKDIYPVIYLGKVNKVQFTFDLTDDGVEGGAQNSDDTKLYANDVAQWCMNYYKGNCYEYPVGGWKGENSTVVESYRDRDQYWMEKVYKNVGGHWYQFEGRPRRVSGYSEPLIDEDDFDEIQSISGKPMIANFINFVRKVSIRMYDSSTGNWLIPWVNDTMRTAEDKQLDAETQRTILPLMKTNLRLVIVKSGA